MEEAKEFNPITLSGVLPKSKALVTTLGKGSTTDPSPENISKKAEPTIVKLKTPDTQSVKEVKFANWGSTNKDPNLIIADIDSIPTAARSLVKKVESTYGLGPFFYQIIAQEDKEVIKPFIPEGKFKEFLEKIRINKFCMEMLFDAEGLSNVFPEFIVSNDYQKITSIRHQEAKHCRWSVLEDGRSKYCGISSEWGTNESVTAENCTVVMVADPWMTVDELKGWLKKNKVKKFIYPVSVPSIGKVYYQKPAHDSSRKGNWNEIAKLIPTAILNTIKNAKRLQWHVQIPYEYWDREFPKGNYTNEKEGKREEDMRAKMDEVDNFLSGADNSGKTFYSHYGTDPITKKEYSGWKFTPLDGNPKFDKDVIATSTANSEISIAWGVDPAVLGMNQLGQKNGAGSGSDKREADEIMKGNKLVSDLVSEPIEFAIKFNGYGEDIKMGFKKTILTTLDKNPTGTQKQGV
ncbi:MAG: hypothetical protein J5I47_13400 [Vicingus serpentipes]|nr:hypothetical protein [Vicingus serpentipes]